VALASVVGRGPAGYEEALDVLVAHLRGRGRGVAARGAAEPGGGRPGGAEPGGGGRGGAA
jgi:hypothetical protein